MSGQNLYAPSLTATVDGLPASVLSTNGSTVQITVPAGASPATKTVALSTLAGTASDALAFTYYIQGTPSILGATRPGSVLSVSIGSWTPQPVAFAYQWMQSGTSSGAYSPIACRRQQLHLPGSPLPARQLPRGRDHPRRHRRRRDLPPGPDQRQRHHGGGGQRASHRQRITLVRDGRRGGDARARPGAPAAPHAPRESASDPACRCGQTLR